MLLLFQTHKNMIQLPTFTLETVKGQLDSVETDAHRNCISLFEENDDFITLKFREYLKQSENDPRQSEETSHHMLTLHPSRTSSETLYHFTFGAHRASVSLCHSR